MFFKSIILFFSLTQFLCSNTKVFWVDEFWVNTYWEVMGQTVYAFDSNGQLKEELYLELKPNNYWVNDWKITYDSINAIKTIRYFKWSNNWELYYQISTEYLNDKIIQVETRNDKLLSKEIKFFSNKKLDSVYNFDYYNNAWVFKNKSNFQYHDSLILINNYYFHYILDDWFLDSKVVQLLDKNRQLLRSQVFRLKNGNEIIERIETFNYLNGKIKTHRIALKKENYFELIDSLLTEYSYNENGFIADSTQSLLIENKTELYSKVQFIYNNSQLSEIINQNRISGKWANSKRKRLFETSHSEELQNKASFRIINKKILCESGLLFDKYEIISISGEIVQNSIFNNSYGEIDLSGFASGIYIIKLRTSFNQIFYFKFILE